MKFCVVASGSKGNMTYIETNSKKILIDTGVSLTNASKRCPDIDFNNITDIFITHEHIDHIHFLPNILKKTNANLYISKKSFMNLKPDIFNSIKTYNIRFIEGESRYVFDDFEVLTLILSHDTKETFGYIFISEGKSVGYITDTGIFPNRYKSVIMDLDALIIEANHNVEMLVNSDRDLFLINRILSTKGHLSNQACFDLLNESISDKIKHIILAHISEDCNTDECLYNEIINKLIVKYKGEIFIARQHEAMKIIEL